MLRALEPEDLDFIYLIENDASLWQYGPHTAPLSQFMLRDFIAHSNADIYKDGQLRLIIEQDGVAVGLADLFDFDPKHNRAEVGIVVIPEQQRHGYALDALRQLEDYAHQAHIHQLYAIIADDNVASIELFRKAGYAVSAILPQWLRLGDTYQDACLMTRFL